MNLGKWWNGCLLLLFLSGVLHAAPQVEQIKVDANLPAYSPQAKPTGEVVAVGSDAMQDLWDEWRRAFVKVQPGVKLSLSHKLSAEGVKALLEGRANLVYLAKEMSPAQIKEFEAKFGYQPIRIPIAIDAIVVFTNVNNPLEKISFQELDAIFSTTRNAGAKEDISNWGGLGLKGEWKTRPIRLVAREEGAATRQIFKDKVLLKGDFKASVEGLSDNQAIAEAVMMDASSLGFGPTSIIFSRIRPLALLPAGADTAIPLNAETVTKGTYPLTRFFYLYVNRPPDKPVDPALSELLRFLLSREGQACAAASNYFPIPAEMANMSLKRIR